MHLRSLVIFVRFLRGQGRAQASPLRRIDGQRHRSRRSAIPPPPTSRTSPASPKASSASISSTSFRSNRNGSAPRSSRRRSPRLISPQGRSSSSLIRELCSPAPSLSPPELSRNG
ncbi:hypothetical protein N665_0378s0014 [Sinapis alba]|nr:hypothetical protein N665_0378s0014 [Sinapis alba]